MQIIVKLNSFTVRVSSPAGNRAWFRRAYDRAKQQAEDEGRSLEDVAAERWGVSIFGRICECGQSDTSYLKHV